jgi:secreted trypsin-like serine protease
MSHRIRRSGFIGVLFLLAPLTLAFATHGCSGGGPSDPTPTPSPTPVPTPVPETIQAIGTVTESEVAFVGKLATQFGAASGVLIAPQYIVTAAHNVSNNNREVIKPFSITFGTTNYTITNANQVKVHPSYNGVSFVEGDIAVVKLDNPVTNITPATRYAKSDEVGKQVVHKGFGIRNSNNNGKLGYNIIDATADQLSSLGFKTAEQPQTTITTGTSRCLITDYDDGQATNNSLQSLGSITSPMPQEIMVTAGDSGAGLCVRTNKGLRLVGIAVDLAIRDSNTDNTTESIYGRISSYTRVSTYKDWIDSNLN